jgi:hypothetical protein
MSVKDPASMTIDELASEDWSLRCRLFRTYCGITYKELVEQMTAIGDELTRRRKAMSEMTIVELGTEFDDIEKKLSSVAYGTLLRTQWVNRQDAVRYELARRREATEGAADAAITPSMGGYTPGPWKAGHRSWKGEHSEHNIYISGNEHESWDSDDLEEDPPDDRMTIVSTGIAIVQGNATSGGVTAANARLIVQVPEYARVVADLVREWQVTKSDVPRLATLAPIIDRLIAVHRAATQHRP